MDQPIEDDYYMLIDERIDLREFELVLSVIDTLLQNMHTLPQLSKPPIEYIPAKEGGAASQQKQSMPFVSKKSEQLEKMKENNLQIKNKLFEAAQERRVRQEYMPELIQE